MKVTILGSTGDLGKECLQQCLDAGHEVTVLVRRPAKLPAAVKDKKLSKLMPLINLIACNIGKAANDPKKNK